METIPLRCYYCTKKVIGFAGPVEPAGPDLPDNPPPGSGFYRVEGPSDGTGFREPPRWYCSANHMARVEERGEAPAAAQEAQVIDGWRPLSPGRDPSRVKHSKELMKDRHSHGPDGEHVH